MTMADSERHPFIVFYSWQSDLESRTNRGLIGDALEKAAKTLRADDFLRVVPVMDRDTAGKSGAPDIAATIFAKIDKADAFVADVSFITPPTPEDPSRKRCPNPNVLLELGYALRQHGWERVLLVFNECFGTLSDLPFDLRGRRVVVYSSAPEDTDRATPRRLLQDRFEAELRTMVSQIVHAEVKSPLRDAIEGIEQERKNRVALVRTAFANVISRLRNVAPDLAKNTVDSAVFMTALREATPAIADFAQIAAAAASVDDRESTLELVRRLELVAVEYHNPAGFSGTYWEGQFDYWRQVGYELVLGLIAVLLREHRLETLGEVLKMRLHIPNSPRRGSDQVLIHYLNPRGALHQDAWGRAQLGDGSRYISPIGQLVKERYEGQPIAETVTWPEMQAADLFLAIWTLGLPQKSGEVFGPDWIPYVAILLTEPPRFLIDAIRVGHARRLAAALGVASPEALRQLYVDRVPKQVHACFNDAYRRSGINFPIAHEIGSEP